MHRKQQTDLHDLGVSFRVTLHRMLADVSYFRRVVLISLLLLFLSNNRESLLFQ